jgi:Plasmid pRiA4b ORF-3-like protein
MGSSRRSRAAPTERPGDRAPAKTAHPRHGSRIERSTNALDALADPTHPEHEVMLEWVDPDFDPEEVNLDLINWDLALVAKGHEPGIGWG